jgi:hypothetical protein
MTDRQYVIPTLPGMGRGLVNHDDRSKAFRAVDLLRPDEVPRDRQWRSGLAYDQRTTSQCVAFTGKKMLNTSQVSRHARWWRRRLYSTTDFYRGAQLNDEWDGEAYDGTSALGLCRYLTELGILTEYRWCFGLSDVLLTVSHIGAVGIGIWWYDSMFQPVNGRLHVAGDRAGGHETVLTGNDVGRREVILTNSWGRGWGVKGKARLGWDDLDRLLQEDGDAFVMLTAKDVARFR